MANLSKLRARRFSEQAGRCHYCRQPMRLGEGAIFAEQHGLTTSQAAFLQATAEHLTARSEGGSNAPANIVAACAYCNGHRHRACLPLLPAAFQRHVRARLARGRWHGLCLVEPAPG
jgi:5-methylcytosine-specific restriction endonuclease McrA